MDPDYVPLGKGSGPGAPGSGDSADSGSDVHGATGLTDEALPELGRGSNADPGGRERGAGAALGDADEVDLNSDSEIATATPPAAMRCLQAPASIACISQPCPSKRMLVDPGFKQGDLERAAADRVPTSQA